jgi:hypothetical protein
MVSDRNLARIIRTYDKPNFILLPASPEQSERCRRSHSERLARRNVVARAGALA